MRYLARYNKETGIFYIGEGVGIHNERKFFLVTSEDAGLAREFETKEDAENAIEWMLNEYLWRWENTPPFPECAQGYFTIEEAD